MHLVLMGVENQMFPHVEKEIDGIHVTVCVEGVAELETVFVEADNVEALVVKIAIEFATIACETALVEMIPDRRTRHHHLHITEVVVDYQLQILVDTKYRHSIQSWQDIVHHDIVGMAAESMVEEILTGGLVELLDRDEQRSPCIYQKPNTGLLGMNYRQKE